MTRDQRLTQLPPVRTGRGVVDLWHLLLEARPSDSAGALLSSRDRDRLAVLPPQEAQRLLARRALLAVVVAERLGCAAHELWLGAGVRSVVASSGRTVHISLSASGGRGLLAVAPHPVGVDLEQDCAVPEAGEIARRMLSEGERSWVQAAAGDGPDGFTDRFLRIWVRKEAVVKCTGTGLAGGDLQGFTVDAARRVGAALDRSGAPSGLMTVEVPLRGAVAAVAYQA